MATIKGTTAVVNASTINTGDKVIITDNLYEIADINGFFAASGLKIKLEKTSAATVFEDTAADLIAVLESVESYTGPVRATPATTAEDINTLAGLTTGVVTGIITPAAVDSDLVASLTNVKTTDKISFASTATAADATDIVALKAKLPLANFSSIPTINGTSDDVAALKSAANIVKSAAVTVTTGEISAANANALAKISNGAVTATVTKASAAALNKALVDAKGTDALALTVDGKTATAADLKALAGKTSVAVDADLIETITGNAKDVIGLLALGAGEITLGGTPAITVSGTISAADANTIASDTDAGVVTATVAAGTSNSLNLALGALGGNDKLSLTVLNNSDGSATSAADLVALDGKTASKIKVDAKALTGTEANLTAIFVTNKDNFTGLGNKAVSITDVPATADGVNDILKATSGVVTATVAAGDAADLRAALVDAKATDKLTLTVNSPVEAADLKALDAKTSIAVDATAAAIVVNGNAADIKAVIKSAGVDLAGDAVINVTGNKISAADASTITSATTGIVTAEVTAGSAAALNKALVDSNAGANALTLTVTGATAAASDLNGLNGKTTEVVNATAVKTVTGTLTDLGTFYAAAAADFTLNPTLNATVSGVVSVADATNLEILLGDVGGKVTATVAPSTAAALVAIFTTNGVDTDALTFNVVDDKNAGTGLVTATAAADLVNLYGQTSVKVKVDATQISGDYDDLEAVYVSGKAGFSNLGNETVTITDTNNAARVDSILKATTGIVTATVTAASASDLVANLKNAKNDKLTLEISATETKASDLKILDAKTSVAIDADAISKLVGNAADIKAVIASNGVTLAANEVIDVTGKISIADANTITSATTGIVTAEVAAGTAAALNSGLNTDNIANALTLTVTGTTANAYDLNGLNGKTTLDVNAAAIKTVIGSDLSLLDIYTGTGVGAGLSGLGNEAVTVTNEAIVANINSINLDTTGVINVSSVTTNTGAGGAAAFKLADLGDLAGITGLYNLNTVDTVATTITLSIADLLAANDSKKSFDFTVKGDANDTVNITDVSGWTPKEVVDATQYTFTKGTQTITVNFEGFSTGDVVLPA